MRHSSVRIIIVVSSIAVGISCGGNPTGPTASGTLDELLQALRQQGLRVTVGEEISPEANRFFSVPARQIFVNESRVNVFEYRTAAAAAADAALVSPAGQPNPRAMIDWVSTPSFYRNDRLIALYVGCSPETLKALEAALGPPFVVSREMPCHRVN